MYSETDIQTAVDDGAISAEAAAALRAHVATLRETPAVDEESFRLLTGFNDIFVSIAAAILLLAVGWIGQSLWNIDGPSPLGAAFVAATAWMLAEYFTRERRMALPSIVLMLAFSAGILFTQIGLLAVYGEAWLGANPDPRLVSAIGGGVALVTAGATWLHWKRFMVPITVAVGAGALAATAIAVVMAIIGVSDSEATKTLLLGLVFVAGLGMFALAMRWDMSDKTRQTRRSDVAFWLHLLAAPMIAHPLFTLLGVTDGGAISIGAALLVVAIYVAMGVIALAIDRRALLVSALAYVLYALTELFREFGAVELNVALTALVIGSALLLLSAFWQNARAYIFAMLPDSVSDRLPVIAAPATVATLTA